MRKLSLSILAASTMLIATAASAEDQRGRGGGGQGGGHWRGGGGMQMRGGGGMQMRHGGNVQVRNHGGNVRVRHNMPNMRMHHGGGRGHHPGRNFRHHRMQRGGFIHGFWFGSQFHINNWQVYGFDNPGTDYRWVRYYDDACMIDREGRVRQCRYGMDWDRYGEEWEDDDGIPSYRGRRHHDEDEEVVETEGGWDYGAYGPPMPPGHGPMPAPGGAYGGYYGYGAYAYPIVIETITTTGGCGCQEVVEEVYEVRRQRRRTPPRPRPPRRPPPGERG